MIDLTLMSLEYYCSSNCEVLILVYHFVGSMLHRRSELLSSSLLPTHLPNLHLFLLPTGIIVV